MLSLVYIFAVYVVTTLEIYVHLQFVFAEIRFACPCCMFLFSYFREIFLSKLTGCKSKWGRAQEVINMGNYIMKIIWNKYDLQLILWSSFLLWTWHCLSHQLYFDVLSYFVIFSSPVSNVETFCFSWGLLLSMLWSAQCSSTFTKDGIIQYSISCSKDWHFDN